MWGRSMNWRQDSERETQGHVGEIDELAARERGGDSRSCRGDRWTGGDTGKRETQGHVGEIAALAAREQEGDTRSRGEDVPPA